MNLPIILSALCLLLLAACVLCVHLSLKVRKQTAALEKLVASEQDHRKFLVNSASKIIRYDADCKRVYASRSSDPSLNDNAIELIGQSSAEYPGGESGELFEKSIHSVFTTKTNASFNMDSQNDNEQHHVIGFDLLPELNDSGNEISVLNGGQDITEALASKKLISHLRSFDQLTNLPNRLFLYDRMRHLMKKSHTQSAPVADSTVFALMYLDLDAFRELNDLLGYALGDQLLRQVATRLQAILPSTTEPELASTLARLGGDEFAILLPSLDSKTHAVVKSKSEGSDRERLTTLAERIIFVLSQPFLIADQEVYVTGSLGIVLYPEHSDDADQLLLFADSAKCHAKKLGRNNFQFYKTEFTKQSIARIELDTALRKAMQHGELELHYQPQVMQDTRQIIGAEALLRWKHPTLGMIPPDKFIPLAEETGLIVEIGNWVLLTAFRAAAAWNKGLAIDTTKDASSPQLLKIAVNLSSRQFVRNDLVGTVKQLLIETQCLPQWIELEITESLLLDENGDIQRMLMELSDLGIDLSIDDFGTGYSALSYLTRFPISQIKIDRSFICDIPVDLEKCELVKVLIQIAKVLHLDLVAEGIETIEQVEYLGRHGCNIAQGYFYYRPMTYEAFDLKVQEIKSVLTEPLMLEAPTLHAFF